MNLLHHIRGDRTEKKKKLPFRQTVFNRVAGLVKTAALGEGFLKEIDKLSAGSFAETMQFAVVKAKPDFKMPVFSLLTEDEYHVTKKIIESVNAPYLYFANSPEEILLCNTLFSQNAFLEPDRLACCHFETLLICELAKEKVKELKKQAARMGDGTDKISEDEQVRMDSLLERIKQLDAFIGEVEGIRQRPER